MTYTYVFVHGALATAPSGMAGISTADDVAAVSEIVRRAAEHGPV